MHEKIDVERSGRREDGEGDASEDDADGRKV